MGGIFTCYRSLCRRFGVYSSSSLPVRYMIARKYIIKCGGEEVGTEEPPQTKDLKKVIYVFVTHLFVEGFISTLIPPYEYLRIVRRGDFVGVFLYATIGALA